LKLYLKIFVLLLLFPFSKNTFAQPSYCWAKPVEGSGNNRFHDITTNPINGVSYSVGYFDGDISSYFPSGLNGTPDMSTTYGGRDGLIAKYDAQGNEIWAFKIGGTNDDEVRAIALDTMGNLYITGFFSTTGDFTGTSTSTTITVISAGGDEAFLAKYDSNGNLLWLKTGSGIEDNWGNSITINSNGVFITGWYENTTTFTGFSSITANDSRDVFIAAYNLDGTPRWLRTVGDISSSSYDEKGYAIISDENNIYVTGTFLGTIEFPGIPTTSLTAYVSGISTVFISEYDELTGLRNWVDRIGGSLDCQANGIAVDANFIYLTGMLEGFVNFPGGSTTVTTGSGSEIFTCGINRVSKITSWIQVENNNVPESASANDIVVDTTNSIVYVTGYFEGTTSFDNGLSPKTSLGNQDVFVIARTNLGSFLWVETGGFGGGSNEQGKGISIDPLGGIYVSGWYEQGAVFGPFSLSNGPQDDAFITKLNCTFVCNPLFSYPSTNYCSSDSNPTPVITGNIGGFFSEVSGNISFTDTLTGQINLSTSIPGGPYSIIYNAPGGCDTVFDITISLPPSAPNAGDDQIIVGSDIALLDATNPTIGLGSWTSLSGISSITDVNNPNTLVTNLATGDNIFLWTTANGTCNNKADDVIITVIPIVVPNGFSPNNDGKNDLFVIKGLEMLENEISIFNRWGIELFYKNNYQNDWDGRTQSGGNLPEDTYFYIIKIPQIDKELNGFVVLKR